MIRWSKIVLASVAAALIVGVGVFIGFATGFLSNPLATPNPSSNQNITTDKNQNNFNNCQNQFYPDRILECQLSILESQGITPDISICGALPNRNTIVLKDFGSQGLRSMSGYDYCLISISKLIGTDYCSLSPTIAGETLCGQILKGQ